jgi:DNA-binding SARP family transcriptional activator
MDALIDDLWGAEPPPTAEAVVQNAVSRLRKTLGREMIETRTPGYVLRAEPGAIDARRFERLVHGARPLPAAERASALRDALALWRGPPLADLAFESFLQDEIARLDELRLTALEDRLEAEIELGAHDEAIPAAAALAAQHPARERLCRLLMLALNRAGRQQEALDAYEATRRALDTLWGLEPAAETRALQVMILTQDPAIAATAAVPRTIGAVRRPVALLLVELMLDEDLELEAAGTALAEARRALEDVVARHGGSVSPESGIEQVAAFGAEGAREDDVLRAARAAVELHEILRGREIDARLAVGTGRLLVEEGRPVLIGAVVGQTRRALHEAGAAEILVTPAAARLGGDALELDADGRLLGVRAGRPRTAAAPAPFVGRAAELEALRAAFAQVVLTGRPRHLVVVGEAGIGKTRLVATALEDVQAVVLEAACVPYGEGVTFLPLRELADRADALDAGAPKLGELTGADAAFAAARGLLEHFASSDPLVVVLDDMHWAVPTFLDLIEYVVRAVKGPLLVISLTRPELLDQRSDWGAEAIRLGVLSPADAAELLDVLPGSGALDSGFSTAILAAAGGVPLYLEQMVSFAAEADVATEEIPPSLDTLLASRIDALEPGEREVLERAAIIGRTFPRESLVFLISDEEMSELDGRLAALDRRRLIRVKPSVSEFAHVLVRDAVYDKISRATRAALHERLARRLGDEPANDAVSGFHLERAAKDLSAAGVEGSAIAGEASERLGRAGVWARRAGDAASAKDYLERALDLTPDATRARRLELNLGAVLKELGMLDEAIEILSRLTGGTDDVGALANVELVWPRLMRGGSTIEESLRVLGDAAHALADTGDPFDRARVHHVYAATLGDLAGRNDEAFQHAVLAHSLYGQAGTAAIEVALVGTAIAGTTNLREVRPLCEHHLIATRGAPKLNAYVALQAAYLDALDGRSEQARAGATAARDQLRELGDEFGRTTVGALIAAEIELVAGVPEAARDLLDEAIAAHAGRRGAAFIGWLLGTRALVASDLGEDELAVTLAEKAARATQKSDVRATCVWQRASARAAAHDGRHRRALRLMRRAVEGIDQTDQMVDRAFTRLDLAEVLEASGRTSDAGRELDEAVAMLEEKGAGGALSTTRRRFSVLLHGRPGGAGPLAPRGTRG